MILYRPKAHKLSQRLYISGHIVIPEFRKFTTYRAAQVQLCKLWPAQGHWMEKGSSCKIPGCNSLTWVLWARSAAARKKRCLGGWGLPGKPNVR